MNEQINLYLTEIILTILAILTVLIKNWFEQLRRKVLVYLEMKTTKEQRKVLSILAEEAFALAESAAKDLDGVRKLVLATEWLVSKAKKCGIDISAEDARATIERAWLLDKRTSGSMLH